MSQESERLEFAVFFLYFIFFCQKISLTFDLKFRSSFELKWWLITSNMKKCITIIKYNGNSVINANKFAHRVLFYDVTSSDHMWPIVTKYALINHINTSQTSHYHHIRLFYNVQGYFHFKVYDQRENCAKYQDFSYFHVLLWTDRGW